MNPTLKSLQNHFNACIILPTRPTEGLKGRLEEMPEIAYGEEMKMSGLRKLYDAEPFQPFLIHMANGRRIPVRHREFMALSPSGRTAYVYQMNDDSEVVDVALVTSLELRKSLANGKRDK
jgi:hypothetical protein